MRKILTSINELIREIERNLGNSNKLEDLCEKLEKEIPDVDKAFQYHYNLFLAEIYSSKLQHFKEAEKLCQTTLKDSRINVKVEAILRLSYLYSIEKKFEEASRELQRSISMAGKNQPQLQLIIVNFFERLMENSLDGNIIVALKYEKENNFDGALEIYNNEFEQCEVLDYSKDNQYFCASSVTRLCDIFPEKRKTVDLKKYKKFLHEVERENDEDLGERYVHRKKFLTDVVEFMTLYESRKKMTFDNNLCAKKIIAIYKLKKSAKKIMMNSEGNEVEISKCLRDLLNDKISNPNMINQFVRDQFEDYRTANFHIEKIVKSQLRGAFSDLKKILSSDESEFLVNFESSSPHKKQQKQEKQEKQEKGFKSVKSMILEEQADISKFRGSLIVKINENSNGHEKRYFHFLHEDLKKEKMRLYYNTKQEKASKKDDYYEIKKSDMIVQGKKGKAFERSECKEFEPELCFCIRTKDTNRNFYVPEKADYRKWIQVFTEFNEASMYKSKSNVKDMDNNKSTTPMKSTKKVKFS